MLANCLFSPDPQSAIATGGPGNAPSITSFTGRRETASAASTATTTRTAFAASGARTASTGSGRETAAYPATATPKVVGEKHEEAGEPREGRREGGRSKQAKGEVFHFWKTIGNLPDTGPFIHFNLTCGLQEPAAVFRAQDYFS